MTFRDWLRRLDPRQLERQARRVEAVAAATRTTREDVRHLQRAVERVSVELRELQTELDRLVAFREGDRDAGSRLDALVTILDPADLAAHLRRVVAGSRVGTSPTPHVVLEGLFPPAVYQYIVEMVPPRVFARTDRRGSVTCRVPPTMAPTVVMAAWTLLSELVHDVLGPAVLARLSDGLDARCRAVCPAVSDLLSAGISLTAEPGAIVYPSSDSVATAGHARPWEWATVELCLGGEVDARADSAAGPTAFRPNAGLVALTALDGRRPMRIEREPQATAHFIWETRLGLSVEQRRRLLNQMDAQARENWHRLEEESR